VAKIVKNAAKLAKIQVLYETEHGEFNFGLRSTTVVAIFTHAQWNSTQK